MSYNPMIKEWELYFKSKYGSENRTNIAKAFTSFIDSKDDKLTIPGSQSGLFVRMKTNIYH